MTPHLLFIALKYIPVYVSSPRFRYLSGGISASMGPHSSSRCRWVTCAPSWAAWRAVPPPASLRRWTETPSRGPAFQVSDSNPQQNHPEAPLLSVLTVWSSPQSARCGGIRSTFSEGRNTTGRCFSWDWSIKRGCFLYTCFSHCVADTPGWLERSRSLTTIWTCPLRTTRRSSLVTHSSYGPKTPVRFLCLNCVVLNMTFFFTWSATEFIVFLQWCRKPGGREILKPGSEQLTRPLKLTTSESRPLNCKDK